MTKEIRILEIRTDERGAVAENSSFGFRHCLRCQRTGSHCSCRSSRVASGCQCFLLGLEKLSNSGPAQSEHGFELTVVECRFFTRALRLDEFAGLSHPDGHAPLGGRVFDVAKIEQHL